MKTIGILLLGSLVLLFQGCAATTSHYAAPYETTWNATMSTMKDMNMKIYSTEQGAKEGTIYAVQPNGKEVEATLKAESQQVTAAKFRVGTMGDSREERLLDEGIRAKLPKS